MKKIYWLEHKNIDSENTSESEILALQNNPNISLTDITKPVLRWYKCKAALNAFGDASIYFTLSVYFILYIYVSFLFENNQTSLPFTSLRLSFTVFSLMLSVLEITLKTKNALKLTTLFKKNRPIILIIFFSISLLLFPINLFWLHKYNYYTLEQISWLSIALAFVIDFYQLLTSKYKQYSDEYLK